MKKRTVLAVLFVLGQGVSTAPAASGNASGPAALALAGVVAAHSSALASYDRRAMARLFGGNSAIGFPPNRKISVAADSIVCRASNVDITSRTCDLTFGAGKRHLKGREANELTATLAAAGVAPEGAAGSIVKASPNSPARLTRTRSGRRRVAGRNALSRRGSRSGPEHSGPLQC